MLGNLRYGAGQEIIFLVLWDACMQCGGRVLTPCSELYEEVPPKSGAFFAIAVYERREIFLRCVNRAL